MAYTKIPGNLIETGAITAAALDNDSVTTAKILDGNITHAKLHTSMDLTGKTVTVATAAGSTNTTAAASTAFVQQELTTLIGGAPGTLDTLNELAAAINNDDDYHTTLTTALATKLPLAGGTLTGALTSNSLIKTTADLEVASAQPRIILDRGDGAYTWNIYNGNGSGNFPNSTFNIANNGGTAVITALDNGRVGIGTINPTAKLHVVDNDSDDYIAIFKQTHTSNLGTVNIDTPTDNNSRPSRLDFSRGGTLKWKTGMVYGDTSNGWGLSDATGSGTAIQQTRFLVQPGGNVGIGTTNPTSLLYLSASSYPKITLNDETGVDRAFSLGTNNETFVIRNETASSNAVSIDQNNKVGIGTDTPQRVLEVECPSEDFVTLGARTLGTSSNWAGVHFGYKENNNSYRKSAIVFERTDLTENNAQGKVHIFNGPQSGSGNATLSDRALTIHEDGTVELGRPGTLSTEKSYAKQTFQFDLDCHVNGSDEAAEEKDAVFSKIWRKSAVLHPGAYSNGNYYVGIGVSSADTVNYVVFKVNLDKATELFASTFVANSADATTRANKVYYSLDDTNWTQLNSNNWAAGGNTSSGTLNLSTLPGFQTAIATGQGNFFTGTIFLKFAIEGTGSGHSNLIGWQSFTIRARAQHASLTGGGFGRSKNDLTLSGNSNTGHGYTPLLHSYGHQFTGQNAGTIVANNNGTQTFVSNGFGHLEQSIFKPVTNASDGLNGIQVLKTGILHCTFIQDIITVGSTSYTSCTVRRYNEAKTNSAPVCYTLRTNTDGQWDMINGQFICDVVAGDYITFTYNAGSIASMDNGTWSHYGLMLHPSAITSQGSAGTNLPWIHQ